jgi:hypothetical protein
MKSIRTHVRLGGILAAAALAVTAITASAASAFPAYARPTSSLAVQSNRLEQAAPRAATYQGPCTEVCSGGAASYGATSQLAGAPDESGAVLPHNPHRPPQVAATISQVSASEGFDWGDAGIGAGFAVAIVLLATAGTVAVRHRTQLREA